MEATDTISLDEVDDMLAQTWPPVDNPDLCLGVYIPSVLNIRVPDVAVCHDHQAPAELYRAAWRGDPAIYQIGPRTGGKSYNAATLTWLDSRAWPGMESYIVGGSLEQAIRCYEHSHDHWWALGGRIRGELRNEPTMRQTVLRNGSRYGVLAASQKSVRSPHGLRLIVDEADELSEDLYEGAMSIPLEQWIDGELHSDQLVVLSTINHAGGIVEKIMTGQKGRNWTPLVYCWKEVAQPCHESCSTCVLASFCNGELHREDLQGFRSIPYIRNRFNNMSEETWNSEWCCNLKQPLGAVLKRVLIDRARTNIDYDERLAYTWLGIDWGYRNETCCVVLQWDGKQDLRIIDELHWTERTGAELGKLLGLVGEKYKTQTAYCDASDPDKAKVLRQMGWTVYPVAFGAWKNRCLEALRVWLQCRGGRRVQIKRDLVHLTTALVNWKYKDVVVNEDAEIAIEKKDDHPCDAVLAGMKRFARAKPARAKQKHAEGPRDMMQEALGVK